VVDFGEKGKKESYTPIDSFFGRRTRGAGHVSRSLHKGVLSSVLENSYRKVEKISGSKMKKETIRQRLIEKGEMAGKMNKTTKEKTILREKEARDAGSERDTYKKNRGGRIRNVLGSLFKWNRRVLRQKNFAIL